MDKMLKLYLENRLQKTDPTNLVINDNEATLYIYDVISPEEWDGNITAKSVTAQLDTLKNNKNVNVLNVMINSPGGSIFEARAIKANIERFHGKTVAHIDSLCASAATSIALACQEVRMRQGAFFMIHNASGLAWGDKTAMRDMADMLEKIETAIVGDYVDKTGKDEQTIRNMMDAETWLTANEAIDNGFVDAIDEKQAIVNSWNLGAYNHVPNGLDPVQEETDNVKNMSRTNANRMKLLEAM